MLEYCNVLDLDRNLMDVHLLSTVFRGLKSQTIKNILAVINCNISNNKKIIFSGKFLKSCINVESLLAQKAYFTSFHYISFQRLSEGHGSDFWG